MSEENKFLTLHDAPHLRGEYIKLVEQAFDYDNNESFSIDFYPLVCLENAKNCWMLVNSNEIVATAAFLYRKVEKYSVAFVGAISVAHQFRGHGFGKKIVSDVLHKISKVAWVGLWSEKTDFFKYFGFVPHFDQYFIPVKTLISKANNWATSSTPLDELSASELQFWKESYILLEKKYMTVCRTEADWKNILSIASAQYITVKNSRNIQVGYAVVGKGMDLRGVVHEYYVQENEEDFLKYLNQQYQLWGNFSQYPWSKPYLGKNLLLKQGDQWPEWKQSRELFISGVDSV